MDVEIKLSGSGLEYTGNVTLFQATQIMAFISKPTDQEIDIVGSGGQRSIESSIPKNEPTSKAYESPRQAIDKLGAKTNPQKIVAIAFYLGASSQNDQLFTIEEILTGFSKAGAPTPKNITRDLKEAVGAGYIYAEDKNTYRLLSLTDDVVTEGFKKQKAKRRTTPKQAGDTKKTKAVVRDEVNALSLQTSMEGYVDLFTLKVRGDQILWLIRYAKSNGIAAANRQEIIYIAKKMGVNLDSQNYASSNAPNTKNGFISLEGDLIALTPKGETHLKDYSKDEN